MDGVQEAIDAFNAADRRATCASADGAVPGLGRRRVPRRRGVRPRSTSRPSTSATRRPAAGRSTSPTTSSGTTAAATRARSPRRSGTARRTRQAPTALPFGVSVRDVPQPRPDVIGSTSTARPPRRSRRTPGDTHWYAGYESQSDNILDVDVAGRRSTTLDFWNWHFIEEGWDYGFVEALVTASGSPCRWSTTPATDGHRRTTTRTATTPRATASPAPRAASTSSTSRSTCTTRRSCRPAPPTCGSATRPTRPTSTPAGSSTTCTVERRAAALSSADGRVDRDRRHPGQQLDASRSSRAATSPRASTRRARSSTARGNCVYRFDGRRDQHGGAQHQVRERQATATSRLGVEPAHRGPAVLDAGYVLSVTNDRQRQEVGSGGAAPSFCAGRRSRARPGP